jgi:hypothetical protein
MSLDDRHACIEIAPLRKQPAQLGDMVPDLRHSRSRSTLPVQIVCDLFHGDDPIRMEQQDRKHCTLPWPA